MFKLPKYTAVVLWTEKGKVFFIYIYIYMCVYIYTYIWFRVRSPEVAIIWPVYIYTWWTTFISRRKKYTNVCIHVNMYTYIYIYIWYQLPTFHCWEDLSPLLRLYLFIKRKWRHGATSSTSFTAPKGWAAPLGFLLLVLPPRLVHGNPGNRPIDPGNPLRIQPKNPRKSRSFDVSSKRVEFFFKETKKMWHVNPFWAFQNKRGMGFTLSWRNNVELNWGLGCF